MYFMPLIVVMSLYFPSMTLVPLLTLLITPSFLTCSPTVQLIWDYLLLY